MDPLPIAEFTAWFLVAITFVVICFDLMVGFRHGAELTISRQLLLVATQYPILVLGIGILLGHVFWPQRL